MNDKPLKLKLKHHLSRENDGYWLHFDSVHLKYLLGDSRIDGDDEWEVIQIKPVPKKQVWQWRYKNSLDSCWHVDSALYTEELAKREWGHAFFEKHAGPFEVEP